MFQLTKIYVGWSTFAVIYCVFIMGPTSHAAPMKTTTHANTQPPKHPIGPVDAPTTDSTTAESINIKPTLPTGTRDLTIRSSFITKLNLLALYIYNGLDALADGQKNHTLDHKNAAAALAVLRQELGGMLQEQRNMRTDQRAGLDALRFRIGQLKTVLTIVKDGNVEMTSEMRGLKSELDGVVEKLENISAENVASRVGHKTGVHDLMLVINGLKKELLTVNAEMLALKSGIEKINRETNVTEREKSNNGSEIILEQIYQSTLEKWCGADWSLYRDRCYRFFDTARKWPYAQRECTKLGATTARVRSQRHNTFLVNLTKGHYDYHVWIGGQEGNGKWVWTDGTTVGEGKTYSNWNPGHPIAPAHNRAKCIDIDTGTKRWNSNFCSYNFYYVCEKPAQSVQ